MAVAVAVAAGKKSVVKVDSAIPEFVCETREDSDIVLNVAIALLLIIDELEPFFILEELSLAEDEEELDGDGNRLGKIEGMKTTA